MMYILEGEYLFDPFIMQNLWTEETKTRMESNAKP